MDQLCMLELSDVQQHWKEGGHPGQVLAGMSDVTAMTGRTEASVDGRGALARGEPLAVSAKIAAQREYALVPVGSETLEQLLNRIAGTYWDARWGTWTGNATPELVGSDAQFHRVVRNVAPASRRLETATKAKPEDLFKPTPGAKPIHVSSISDALRLAAETLRTYNTSQQQALAKQILDTQKAGGKIYVPYPVQKEDQKKAAGYPWATWNTSTKVLIGVGVAGAALLFLGALTRPRRGSTRFARVEYLPPAAAKALPSSQRQLPAPV